MSGKKLSKVKKADCTGSGKQWIVGKGCYGKSKLSASPKKSSVKKFSGKKLSKVKKADCSGSDKEWIVGKGCFGRQSAKKVSSKKQSVKKAISSSPKKVVKKSSPKKGGCVEKSAKKYQERPSPPYSAQDCPGEIMNGNDGKLYQSKANVHGVYSWKSL